MAPESQRKYLEPNAYLMYYTTNEGEILSKLNSVEI